VSKIIIKNDTAPATPESGSTALYVDSTTKKLHSVNDAGVDTEYGTGGGGGGSTLEITYVKDVKTAASFGGTFTSGAWRTRDLNTLTGATGSVSVATNQITLTAGTYHIEATAPAANVNGHQSRFQNITDATTEILGSSEYVSSAANTNTISRCTGVITVASTKVYEFQHRCQTSAGSFGYGLSSNFSVDTVYAQIKITKIT